MAIKTEVESALALKADKSAHEELVQTVSDNKEAVDEALLLKASITYVNEELAKKADKATSLAGYGITDAYTKEEVNAELLLKASQQDHNALVDVVNGKADKADTLAGYGITDAYTSEQVDDLIAQLSGDNSESAASVLAQLNTYKNENDARVGNVESRDDYGVWYKHKAWNDITATNYIIYEIINVEEVNVKSGDIVVDIKDKSLLEKMKISKEDYYKYRKRLISVLEIKKMFPVKEGVYWFAELQVDNELSLEEVQRRILMQKEYRFCRKIKKQIVEKANRIYDKQMRTGKVLKFHCDYKKLEKACKDYKIP